MSEQEAISVKILDREYTFSCEPKERRQLQDAAEYLDQQMREVRDAGGLPGLEKVAVMTALNIANDFLQISQSEKRFSVDVASRVKGLKEKLEQSMASN
jgi:cell division protein ZapA